MIKLPSGVVTVPSEASIILPFSVILISDVLKIKSSAIEIAVKRKKITTPKIFNLK